MFIISGSAIYINITNINNGTEQSPINIISSDTVKGNDNFKVRFVNSKFEIEDTGHSVEFLLDEEQQSNNYVIFNESKYNFIQIHFHNQRENEIDGIKYPLEAHFVSKNDEGKLLVTAVMLETGKKNMAISDNFLKVSQDTELNPMYIICDESNYYTFKSSLTIPPCTENITWVVLKDTTSLSEEQLEQFKKYYTNNFRPVQPINGRVITSN